MIMLVRWTPFNEMARLSAEIDRLFDGAPSTVKSNGAALWDPAVDVAEDAEKIVIHADLPGVDQQGLDIELEQNVLTIKGARTLAREAKATGEAYRRYERTAGTFARSFKLPPTVDGAKIAAALKDGVLTVTLPKRAEAQPHKIKVSVQQ
jgi:HSP20 family protein